MKILLVVPSNIKYHHPIIPLGLLYIGTALTKINIKYEFCDLNFHSNPFESLKSELGQFQPDIVGFSIRNIAETSRMNNIYNELFEIVSVAKKFAKIILGGAGFSIFPKEIMAITKADYGIIGSGEEAFIYAIKNNNTLPKGSIISIIDKSFRQSDISGSMQKYWNKYGKYFLFNNVSIPIQTVRGCLYNCRYCPYPYLSNHAIQERAIEVVIDEINKSIEITKIKSLYFVDSVFNLNLSYAKELLREIIRNKFDIRFTCNINPINYDEELIRLMVESGCENCEVGIDSFADSQLKAMNKGFNSYQARFLLEQLEEFNLPYNISLILCGYLETERSLTETFKIADSYRNIKINAFIGERVYPQTPLSKELSVVSEESLYMAVKDSIHIENSVIPLLKTFISQASSKRWHFVGGVEELSI
ncbi:MAG: cobalamin-dependent protein [Lachnospiraceae bacterium]|nr:cobalamin-dependent protein [Lachnospiraceae bacterium]